MLGHADLAVELDGLGEKLADLLIGLLHRGPAFAGELEDVAIAGGPGDGEMHPAELPPLGGMDIAVGSA